MTTRSFCVTRKGIGSGKKGCSSFGGHRWTALWCAPSLAGGAAGTAGRAVSECGGRQRPGYRLARAGGRHRDSRRQGHEAGGQPFDRHRTPSPDLRAARRTRGEHRAVSRLYECARRSGLCAESCLAYDLPAGRPERGIPGLQKIVPVLSEIDGVVCFNDLVAAGAVRACTEMGVRIPDDIAITGCDDIQLATLVQPSLTTLQTPKQDIGALAVRCCSNGSTAAYSRDYHDRARLIIRKRALARAFP